MKKARTKPKKNAFDYTYFMLVMILLTFGLIMVFSASSPHSYYTYDNSYKIIGSQLLFTLVGLVCMFFLASLDYKVLRKFAPIILIGCLVMLVLVLIIGTEVKGGKRWINLGVGTLQPSEFAKIGMIIFFAYALEKTGDKIKSFKVVCFPYLALTGLFALLLILEHHMSGMVVFCCIGVMMILIAGAKLRYFMLMSIPAIAGGFALIFTSEYRMKRLTSFLDPLADKLGDGWQITQSLYAIGSGGPFGLGLGRSRQKFLYIPEPQNDFIFSIICEELGFIGAVTVLLLFVLLIWRGIKIAIEAPDRFGSLMAFGITGLITIQVLINIAVVTSSMPVTGMPLPFFSAGGSSMISLLCGMGIMLSISRYSKKNKVPS